MESFIFMCLCAVGVRLSVETTENRVRAFRARGRFECRFWPRASSGCRGDPYAASAAAAGRRPGSLGALLLRRSDRLCTGRRRSIALPSSQGRRSVPLGRPG